ncbi:hypothetical protein NM208_g8820 [Fusarium decemcellulare]|uniref:Uncharacterized protein n=1 Tax=Fusarium decemcellulare TaxID=57161 RepID=A0ACC1S3T1_9HYPO|nr:hypothetical protein NM208_g8820 [Fusarium decemcellulare]
MDAAKEYEWHVSLPEFHIVNIGKKNDLGNDRKYMTEGNSRMVVVIEVRLEYITKNSPTEAVELMVEEDLGDLPHQLGRPILVDNCPILPDFSANPGSAAERAAFVGPTMPDPVSKRELVNASRRVANMTPSQIQSKRSIDRENQRYFRAKRKTKLEQLQSQVDALTRELENTRRELQGSQAREKNWSETFAALRLLGPGKNVDKGRIEWVEDKPDQTLNEDEAFSQHILGPRHPINTIQL